jgi:ABC-type glycerol-3-phosphate transport system substrate-binding protein
MATTRRDFLGSMARVVATMPLLVAGCGAPAAPTTAPAAAPPTTAPAAAPTTAPAAPATAAKAASKAQVTIRFMDRDGAGGEFQRVWSREFEKRNPNITVKNESHVWADLTKKVPVVAAAGTVADLVFQHSVMHLPNLAAKGIWAEVKSYGDAEKHDWKQYWPFVLDHMNQGPKKTMVAMPLGCHVGENHLCWNRTMLQKAGIKEPTKDMTLDQMTELFLDIKKAYPNAVPTFTSDHAWYMAAVARMWKGGYLINDDPRDKCGLNLPATQQAYQYMWDLNNKHKVAATRANLQEGSQNMWAAEKLVTVIGPNMNYFVFQETVVKDKFEMASINMPRVQPDVFGTAPGVDTTVIWKDSKVKDECWALAKLLSSFEVSKSVAMTTPKFQPGSVIAAWNDPDVRKAAPPYAVIGDLLNEFVQKGWKFGDIPVPSNTRFTEFTDKHTNDWQAMKFGEKPFNSDTLNQLHKDLQAIMDLPMP